MLSTSPPPFLVLLKKISNLSISASSGMSRLGRSDRMMLLLL